jgi:prophage regulatory protein
MPEAHTAEIPLLIRERDLLPLIGKKHTQLREDILAGTFPAPVSIGARAVAWKRSDVLAWIEARPYVRPASAPSKAA